jgi:ATP-dependent DNA helicase RecG
VIGVEEANGRPVLPPKGIDPESVESMQKELLRLGNQAIQPLFHALSASYAVDGRTVVVVWAPGARRALPSAE